MRERHFFDTSAFLAILKKEEKGASVLELIGSLGRTQRVTSVLVAYELFRGIAPHTSKRKSQFQNIEQLLDYFTVKPVTEAHAMEAAKIFRNKASKGAIDPILAAQCIEGRFRMVTLNVKDFEDVDGIKFAPL